MKEVDERERGHFKEVLSWFISSYSQFCSFFSICFRRVKVHSFLLCFMPLKAVHTKSPGSLVRLGSGSVNGRH